MAGAEKKKEIVTTNKRVFERNGVALEMVCRREMREREERTKVKEDE